MTFSLNLELPHPNLQPQICKPEQKRVINSKIQISQTLNF